MICTFLVAFFETSFQTIHLPCLIWGDQFAQISEFISAHIALIVISIAVITLVFSWFLFFVFFKISFNKRQKKFDEKLNHKVAELEQLILDQKDHLNKQKKEYLDEKNALLKVLRKNYAKIFQVEELLTRTMFFNAINLNLGASACLWGLKYILMQLETGSKNYEETNHFLALIQSSLSSINKENILEIDFEQINILINKIIKIEDSELDKTFIYKIKGDINSIFYALQKEKNISN